MQTEYLKFALYRYRIQEAIIFKSIFDTKIQVLFYKKDKIGTCCREGPTSDVRMRWQLRHSDLPLALVWKSLEWN